MTTVQRRGSPISPIDRARLATAIRVHGLPLVLSAAGGISRGGLTAALAGLPVLAGTHLAVKHALDALAAQAEREQQAADLARDSGGLS